MTNEGGDDALDMVALAHFAAEALRHHVKQSNVIEKAIVGDEDVYEILSLLNHEALGMERVRSADLALLDVDLNAIAPMGDELASLYE